LLHTYAHHADSVVMGHVCVPLMAQEAIDLRMLVPANASVRSRMLPMVITDELDVRLEYTAKI
jgi:hypothetical protein